MMVETMFMELAKDPMTTVLAIACGALFGMILGIAIYTFEKEIKAIYDGLREFLYEDTQRCMVIEGWVALVTNIAFTGPTFPDAGIFRIFFAVAMIWACFMSLTEIGRRMEPFVSVPVAIILGLYSINMTICFILEVVFRTCVQHIIETDPAPKPYVIKVLLFAMATCVLLSFGGFVFGNLIVLRCLATLILMH
jgi:hypothetical protein